MQAPQSSAQLARTIASWQTFELSLRLMANVLMLVMHHCGWFVHELGKVCRDNTGQQRCGLGTMRQMTIQQRRPCAVTPRFATRACAGKEIDDGCTSAEWVREFVGESSFMKGSGKGRGDMYFSHPGGRSDGRDTAWHCSNNSVTRDLISIVAHPGGCHARCVAQLVVIRRLWKRTARVRGRKAAAWVRANAGGTRGWGVGGRERRCSWSGWVTRFVLKLIDFNEMPGVGRATASLSAHPDVGVGSEAEVTARPLALETHPQRVQRGRLTVPG